MIKKIILLISLCIAIIIAYNMKITLDCPIYKITGLYCPGCGITRCIIALIHLDIYSAFRYNPLVFILLPFLITYLFYKIDIWLFEKKDKISQKLTGYPIYSLIIILIIYGILRNISIFSWLAPTEIH
jgi:hypothetical protein